MTPSTDSRVDAAPLAAFGALGVHPAQQRVLLANGITEPFPIQTSTLPDSLAGRDVLGRGKTGSGKTLAFALPTVHRLAADRSRPKPGAPRALVLVPTRELANQVAETFEPLAKASHLRVAVVYGGVGQGSQVAALKAGVDILIACPGRLEDLVGQRHCRLDATEITVLDEADHMADMGFLPGVTRLLDRTPSHAQRLLFSATLDNGVDILVRKYLHDPVVHEVDDVEARVEQTHHVFTVSAADKVGVVTRLAAGSERTLLFMRTKHGAKKLVKQLAMADVAAVELHGNLSQNARERNLAAFGDGSVTVLVATDIAARGIHVDDVRVVVHVDPPAEHKAFVHRSGRTARAGATGVVVTIATADQHRDVRDLAKRAGIQPEWTAVTERHPLLAELAGPAQRTSLPADMIKVAPPAGRGGQRSNQHRGTEDRDARPRADRPSSARDASRSAAARPAAARPAAGRPAAGRPSDGRPAAGRPAPGRPAAGRSNTGIPGAGRHGVSRSGMGGRSSGR